MIAEKLKIQVPPEFHLVVVNLRVAFSECPLSAMPGEPCGCQEGNLGACVSRS